MEGLEGWMDSNNNNNNNNKQYILEWHGYVTCIYYSNNSNFCIITINYV